MGGVTKIAMAAFILDVAAKILVNLMLPFSADNELGAFVNIFAVKKIGFGELILIPLFFFIVIKLQTKGFVNYIPWTLKWAIGINFGAATSAYLERLCRGGETYWFFNNHTGAMSLWGVGRYISYALVGIFAVTVLLNAKAGYRLALDFKSEMRFYRNAARVFVQKIKERLKRKSARIEQA